MVKARKIPGVLSKRSDADARGDSDAVGIDDGRAVVVAVDDQMRVQAVAVHALGPKPHDHVGHLGHAANRAVDVEQVPGFQGVAQLLVGQSGPGGHDGRGRDRRTARAVIDGRRGQPLGQDPGAQDDAQAEVVVPGGKVRAVHARRGIVHQHGRIAGRPGRLVGVGVEVRDVMVLVGVAKVFLGHAQHPLLLPGGGAAPGRQAGRHGHPGIVGGVRPPVRRGAVEVAGVVFPVHRIRRSLVPLGIGRVGGQGVVVSRRGVEIEGQGVGTGLRAGVIDRVGRGVRRAMHLLGAGLVNLGHDENGKQRQEEFCVQEMESFF